MQETEIKQVTALVGEAMALFYGKQPDDLNRTEFAALGYLQEAQKQLIQALTGQGQKSSG